MSKVVKKVFNPITKVTKKVGKFFKKHWKKIAIAVAVVAAIYTGGAALGAWGAGGAGAGAGAGAGVGAVGASAPTGIGTAMGAGGVTTASTTVAGAAGAGTGVVASGAGAAATGAAAGAAANTAAPSAIGTNYGQASAAIAKQSAASAAPQQAAYVANAGNASGGLLAREGAPVTDLSQPYQVNEATMNKTWAERVGDMGNITVEGGKRVYGGISDVAAKHPLLTSTVAGAGLNAYSDYQRQKDLEEQAERERLRQTYWGMDGYGNTASSPNYYPSVSKYLTMDDLIKGGA